MSNSLNNTNEMRVVKRDGSLEYLVFDKILNRIKEKYEEHHGVTYTNDAINACVNLTARYITDRFLPDKAIDALRSDDSSMTEQ